MSEWVDCPICGESDMRGEPEGDGQLIYCTNLNCGSNGGTDYHGVVEAALRVAELVKSVSNSNPSQSGEKE